MLRKIQFSYTPISIATSVISHLPQPPALLSGDELYDSIMGSIEPDLLISNMPQVVLEMEHDTQEVKTERIERYNRAFAEYDRRLAEHKQDWDKAYNDYKRASMESLTGFLNAADKDRMTDIERQLDSSL